MKKIHLDALSAKYNISEYKALYAKIIALLQDNKIKPVKASGTNGKSPALYKEYWIIEEKQDMSSYLNELNYALVPSISTDYYRAHISQYLEDRPWVLLLNDYLKQDNFMTQMSENERSFDIWHREKFLKQEQGKKILKRCGLETGVLNYYKTTEPVAYYCATRQTPQKLLVIENKDTFYSMRRYLNGDCRKDSEVIPRRIFGREIGTVIYGAGKGILRSFEDFRFCVESHVNAPENEILYFGDLDYEGIGIYERLAELFGAGENGCEIKPFTQAYEKMLEKAAQGVDFLPETSENQNRNLSGLFFSYFTESLKARMEQILEAGKYIPQESINITDF